MYDVFPPGQRILQCPEIARDNKQRGSKEGQLLGKFRPAKSDDRDRIWLPPYWWGLSTVQVRSAGCEGDAPSLVRGATEANQGVMPMQAILH